MQDRRGQRPSAVVVSLIGWFALTLAMALPAMGATNPEYLSSFGPGASPSSSFTQAGSVAVDQQSGAVYVLDVAEVEVAGGCPSTCYEGSLYKFDSNGNPLPFSGSAGYISGNKISGLAFPICAGCTQVAVDSASHDIYVTSENSIVAFQADGEPANFVAGPTAGTNVINGFGQLRGLAVDANGAIYASDEAASYVYIYSHEGVETAWFNTAEPGNLAVNGSGVVYVSSGSNGVRAYTPSEFPMTAATYYTPATQPLDSNLARTVAVDPATQNVYVAEYGFHNAKIALYDQAGTRLGAFAGPEEEGEVSEPRGIAIIGASGRVFVSDAPFVGLSQVEIFGFQPGAPTIRSTSVTDVTADSATLRGRLNPNSFDTSYRFEYGLGDCATSDCTSVPLGGADIGAGTEAVAVSQGISGLQSGATYHFRIVAENAEGVTNGPDHVFTTQTSGFGFSLADNRAWEMVTPPDKHGALLKGNADSLVQAATDGGGITFPSIGSIEADPEGSRPFEPASVLARRTPDGSWMSKDITPPNDVMEGLPIGNQGQYKAFSSDLSKAVLEPASPTVLSPGGAPESPYLRENSEPPSFTSLVGAKAISADSNPESHPKVAAVTPNLGSVGLKSILPLVEEAPATGSSLYLWSAGQVQPVSALPPSEEGGKMVAGGTIGSIGAARHAISDDGSRVFWEKEHETALYLRYNANEAPSAISGGECTEPAHACTVRLDLKQAGASGTGVDKPIFQGANAEGTVVVFSDSHQLTQGASPEGSDLYRCEIPTGAGAAGCTNLTDVSAPREGSGESAEVENLVAGMSDDGSTIYFIARGILDTGPNRFGDSAVTGRPNLYVWQQGQGVRFIATLSARDSNDWGGEEAREYKRSTAVSPNGRYLAFASLRSLAGEENLSAESHEAVEQVFRYDAGGDRLDCVSCDPTGAAPVGRVPEQFSLVDSRNQWAEQAIAALIPEPPINHVIVNTVFYSPRSVLDNGRVFFNSVDPLVPADSNGQWDVYQYEPTGVGDCTTFSGGAAVARLADGCISLVSSGSGEEEAVFLDAGSSGNDIFFLSSAQLNEPDQDQEYDVYDARVNGVPATLQKSAECLGEACQPLPTAPSDKTPASAAFSGAGNLRSHCRQVRSTPRKGGRAASRSRRSSRHSRCASRRHRRTRKHHTRHHGRVGR